MSMGGFFSKFRLSRKAKGVVGVGILPDKLAVAHLGSGKTGPVLHVAQMLPAAANLRGKVLGDWVRSHGLTGASTVLTLESGAYGLFQVDKPAVEAAEMRAAVRWNIKSYIDYPPDQAIVDVFSVPAGRRGQAGTVYVTAARKTVLKERADLLKKAGLSIVRIDITELALRNLTGSIHQEENEALAVLYFQDRRGWLEVCHQGEFYLARNLDYGVGHLAPLAESQSMAIDNTDMMDRLALEIQRTMDYYESHFGLVPIKRIGLVSETARLDDLGDSVQRNLGVPTSVHTLADFFLADQENIFSQGVPGWVLGGALGEMLSEQSCRFFCESA